ncbi:MAG: corrinoid protein [Desulfobacteraceae bacterium]
MSGIEAIHRAVLEGDVEGASDGIKEALSSGIGPEHILDESLVPAMDLVGEKFGQGEYFIPQVLWSAKAMQACMEILRPLFAEAEATEKGTVVIGTAKGDIHDIGKNLVGMILEGAGFKVVDIGVDVDPARFVETAAEHGGDIIAVSALLTTTMPSMEKVVGLVREQGLPAKVLIGGAPVDQSFCLEIGADAYGADAMEAVDKARELMGRR